MRGGQVVHIEGLAVRRLLALKAGTVPGGEAFLGVAVFEMRRGGAAGEEGQDEAGQGAQGDGQTGAKHQPTLARDAPTGKSNSTDQLRE